MNVLLISECEKKAWKSTRRIVSQYLPQHGSRVWMGSIDKEGLQELHKELKRKVTKNNAIICFVITTRLTKKIAFRVGSQKMFDEQGHYAFSQTKTLMPHEETELPLLTYLHLLSQAAGLLHDIGKSMNSFQEKLCSGKKTDPIRHDLYSALLFLYFVRKTCGKPNTAASPQQKDEAVLMELVVPNTLNSNNLHQCFCDKAARLQVGKCRDLTKALEKCTFGPTIAIVAWLLAGHHIQPDVQMDFPDAPSLRMKKFFHEEEWKEKVKEKNGFNEGKKLPWHDSGWVEKLRNIFVRIKDLPPLQMDEQTLYTYAYLFARPALVAADHLVSAEGSSRACQDKIGNHLYANTTREGEMAQPLQEHLAKVSRSAGSNIRAIRHIWQGTLVDGLSALPETLRKKVSRPRFAWQQAAQTTAREIAREFQPGDAFFGVMIAETGSGKTRAIPRFMGNLQNKGEIRFTLALGLRTLTHQSGAAYKSEIGFEDRDVAVLVGGQFHDDIYSQMEELLKADAEEEVGAPDHTSDHTPDRLLIRDYDFDSHFPTQLAGSFDRESDTRWNRKTSDLARMLQTPVLICTVDHLMAGLVSARASDAKRLNRILSHDLVIDEIDSFDTKDLLALARLVHLSGCAGKKVMISSATLPPVAAELLFRCYLNGFEKFRKIQSDNREAQVFTAWLSHEVSVNRYRKKAWNWNPDQQVLFFLEKHQKIVQQLVQKLDERPIRHKVDFLDLSFVSDNGASQDAPFTQLAASISHKIDMLHDRFKVSDGKKHLSVGLVRLSNTFDAMQLFNELTVIEAPLGKRRSFVFYQANLSETVLDHVESTLNSLLSRKHRLEDPDPIFTHPVILDLFKRYQNTDDFQIIVVATPIEEVGRDHDFDWAILEPTSNWSTIQTAGRVWRHRTRSLSASDPANIVMLPFTCKTLLKKKGMRPYSSPGPASERHRLKPELENSPAEQLFPSEILERLDARYSLVSPLEYRPETNQKAQLYTSIADLEDGCIRFEMESLLRRISHPFTFFTTYYERLYPFRNSNGAVTIRFRLAEDEIWMEEVRLGRKVIKEKLIPQNCLEDFGYSTGGDYRGVLLLDYERRKQVAGFDCQAYAGSETTVGGPVQFFVPGVNRSLRLYYNDVLGGCVRR